MSSTATAHASDNPTTRDNQVGSEKGKFKIPCWLCKEMNCTYLCPHMDKYLHMLENIVNSQPQISTNYHKISPNLPLVDELVNPVPSLVNPINQVVNLVLSLINLINQVIDPSTSPINIVHQMVYLISPSIDPTPPLNIEYFTQVFLITMDSSRQGVTSPVPMTPRLPFYMHFKIMVEFYGRVTIPNTIIDEGYFIIILSSNAWKALGSPWLVSVTHNLLDFNKQITQHLGICPQLLITLGGKTIYIDVIIVHDP
jgi:hypothetical protein